MTENEFLEEGPLTRSQEGPWLQVQNKAKKSDSTIWRQQIQCLKTLSLTASDTGTIGLELFQDNLHIGTYLEHQLCIFCSLFRGARLMWLVLTDQRCLAIFTHLCQFFQLHNLNCLIVQILLGDSCLAIKDLISINIVQVLVPQLIESRKCEYLRITGVL